MSASSTHRSVCAFIYFDEDPAAHESMPQALLHEVLESAAIAESDLKMSVFKTPFKEGRWRGFKRKAVEEAINADSTRRISASNVR